MSGLISLLLMGILYARKIISFPEKNKFLIFLSFTINSGPQHEEILCYNSKTGGFLIALERIFKHFQDREIQKSAFFY